MTSTNSKMAAEITGLESPISTADFAAAADDPARVQLVMDLISYESTDPDVKRLWLDEMTPACRLSLYKVLSVLKAGVS